MDVKIQTLEYMQGAKVEYIVQNGTTVVYCGISNVRQLPEEASTTNASLDILKALAEVIGKPVDELTFFELSTHTSWIFKLGEYDFHSVKPYRGNRKEGTHLVRTRAPKTILETFRHHIGGAATRKYTPDTTEETTDVAS